MYVSLKQDVTKQLKDADYYCITTDMWSSRAKQSYIAVTIHYLTGSFDMRSHLLETKEFPEAHTGDMIAESLEQILMKWELDPDRLVAATMDNGSNIALALRKLGWTRISCFSRTLQLAVEKALNLRSVAKAIGGCKLLVSHFNHSPRFSYVLQQKQYDLKHKQHHLVQSVATRWNSSCYMVQ